MSDLTACQFSPHFLSLQLASGTSNLKNISSWGPNFDLLSTKSWSLVYPLAVLLLDFPKSLLVKFEVYKAENFKSLV